MFAKFFQDIKWFFILLYHKLTGEPIVLTQHEIVHSTPIKKKHPSKKKLEQAFAHIAHTQKHRIKREFMNYATSISFEPWYDAKTKRAYATFRFAAKTIG